MVSTEAVVGTTEVDEEENEEEERLLFFENSISVDMYYVFLDYGPLSGIYSKKASCSLHVLMLG